MPKFTQITANPSPAVGDYIIGHTSGGVDDKITIGQLATLVSANLSSKVMIDRGFSFANNAGSVIPIGFTTYNTVTNASFAGGNVRVHVSAALADGSSGAQRTGHLRVQRDGATLTNSDETWHTVVSGQRIFAAAMFTDNPSAGSHTYTFQLVADTGSASIIQQTAMHVMEAMP